MSDVRSEPDDDRGIGNRLAFNEGWAEAVTKVNRQRERGEGAFAHLKSVDRIGGHPDPAMRRAERGVVRGLATEFGKGEQRQWTGPDRIEIGVGGVVVTIRRDDASDIPALPEDR